jgi:hypothetical protein
MSVVLTKENLCSSGTPDTQCFECLRSLTFPYLEWNWNAARPGFAVDHRGTAQKLAERAACSPIRRSCATESLMLITDYVLSKKVSARDLFGERLKKFGIQDHVASGKDDERSRCLTDGSQCLAVFLTEDGFVDFLTAYGADAPRKILHAICEAFGAKIFSEHEPQFWDLWKAATAERSRNMPT